MDVHNIQRKLETKKLWAEAFDKLAGLPEADQDSIIYWMLQDIESQQTWNKTLAETGDKLEPWAAREIAEYQEYKQRKKEDQELRLHKNRVQ